MKVTNNLKKYALGAVIFAGLTTVSCKSDDNVVPEAENDLEVITDVELIFTNVKDSNDVVKALAQDKDGPGAGEVEIVNNINLAKNKEYELTFNILNTSVEKPEDDHDHDEDDHDDDHKDEDGHDDHDDDHKDEDGHDDHDDDHKDEDGHHDHDHDVYYVTELIEDEAHEHQFFFSFTNNAFTNPTGNGNIDNASDAIQYHDEDKNGLKVGLETLWNTGDNTVTNGEFTIVLKQ